ncbi:XRE family transcriptional regulator [uncultured Massilia sp.]|uniref:XRE family transcriptional regulator n=1 Tax=uncultured Massilia sp. TaxID=169973 RepID=UPI0025F9A438|nr:XRE family transcriptional regulator [uncultured Massilia sp.]
MDLHATIATWVKEARTEAGLSGAALGARLALELGTERGHTKANISHWETRKHSPSLQQLMAIAKITRRSLPEAIIAAMQPAGSAPAAPLSDDEIARLLPGATRVHGVSSDDPTFTHIPKVKLRLSAGISGFEVEPERFDGSTTAVRTDWLKKNGYASEKLIALTVRGESMETTLYDGDLVIVNTMDTKPVDGVVYAFNYEGEPVIKRLSRDAGQWWLTSDNPDQRKYHRKLCQGAACIVVGRVVRRESERL